MPKPRTRKKDAAAAVEDMFEQDEAASLVAARALADEESDRIAADAMGPQPPPHVPDPRGEERAWESYPSNGARCSVCGGIQRVTSSGDVCKRGHGGAPPLEPGATPEESPTKRHRKVVEHTTEHERARSDAPALDVDAVIDAGGTVITRAPEHTAFVIDPGAASRPRAKVTLVEHTAATRLLATDDVSLSITGREDIEGALVKVTAELRPSERASFDGNALREHLRSLGARGVTIAVRPVAEASEAREDVRVAATPEAAIDAWFAALPNVPEDEREAARVLALELLGAERG
jgi:hypothetical protein